MCKYIRDSLGYALVHMFFSFITIVFNYLIVQAQSDNPDKLNTVLGAGESLIICIPLLFSIIYSIFNNKAQKEYNWISSIMFYISIGFLAICIVFYPMFRNGDISSNEFVFKLSIFVMLWTSLALFGSQLFALLASENPVKKRDHDLDALEIRYKKL